MAFLFGERRHGIAQLVQGLAQGGAPQLVVARFSAIAAAIRAPALHSMNAAPGGVLDDFALEFGRELLKKAAVVGELDGLVLFQQAQSVSQGHLTVFVVVPVGFAVGGHVNQLGLSAFSEACLEACGKRLAGVQKPFKCDCP